MKQPSTTQLPQSALTHCARIFVVFTMIGALGACAVPPRLDIEQIGTNLPDSKLDLRVAYRAHITASNQSPVLFLPTGIGFVGGLTEEGANRANEILNEYCGRAMSMVFRDVEPFDGQEPTEIDALVECRAEYLEGTGLPQGWKTELDLTCNVVNRVGTIVYAQKVHGSGRGDWVGADKSKHDLALHNGYVDAFAKLLPALASSLQIGDF